MTDRNIDYDFCGGSICTQDLQRIYGEISAPGDEDTVTLTLKRVNRRRFPRLVADYGDLVEVLARAFQILDNERDE